MRPERRPVALTLVPVVVVLLLVWVLLAWLRATAPTADTVDLQVSEAVPDPDELLGCDELQGPDSLGVEPGTRIAAAVVLQCPREFDGHEVEYAGELVGDVLQRDGGSWVLLNDDAYGLGAGPLGASGVFSGGNSGLTVWLPDPLDELATTPGRRDLRGDVLRVRGTLLREDPADGGGLTVRAEDVELLAGAAPIDVPVHTRQVAAAAVLGVLALGVGLLELRSRRR